MVPDVPSPRLSRRRLLAGAGLALGGGAASQLRLDSIPERPPETDTWPLDRYDARRSGRAPDADVPSSPSVAWRVRPLDGVEALVADRERVYVARGRPDPTDQPSVAALDRRTGETAWTAAVPGETLALGDGTLFVGNPWGETAVAALDAETGDRRWRTVADARVRSLLPAGDRLFVGCHGSLCVLDAADGRSVWAADVAGDAVPVVTDGSPVVAANEVRRYGRRRVQDALVGGPPPTAWTADPNGYTASPVAAGGAVVTGTYGFYNDDAVRAYDAETGERLWRATPADSDSELVRVAEITTDGDRCLHRLRTGKDASRTHHLVCRSLSDGDERWRLGFDSWVTSVSLGGETAVVGLRRDAKLTDADGTPSGRVLAVRPGGDASWSVSLRGPARVAAPVGETVFVGTGPYGSDAWGEGGHVYALRDE